MPNKSEEKKNINIIGEEIYNIIASNNLTVNEGVDVISRVAGLLILEGALNRAEVLNRIGLLTLLTSALVHKYGTEKFEALENISREVIQ